MSMRVLFCFVLLLSFPIVGIAQSKGQGDGQGGGSFPFAGNTYQAGELPTTYPKISKQRLIWYKLVQTQVKGDKDSREKGTTSSQPLALIPLSCDDIKNRGIGLPSEAQKDAGLPEACQNSGSSRWYAPSFPDRRNPLRDGDHLVIAIADPYDLIFSGDLKIELLTINVVAAGASPLNPSPLRPAISAPAGAGVVAKLGEVPPSCKVTGVLETHPQTPFSVRGKFA